MQMLFRLCGAAAGVLLVALTCVVVVQIILRGFGVRFPGAHEIAGYCLAGSMFLGLAYTLRAGGHIRVELLLTHLPARLRIAAEVWCYSVGLVVSSILAAYSARMTWDSFAFNSMSPGLLRIPLWMPQTAMAVGTIVLAAAFADGLLKAARGTVDRHNNPESC